MVSRTCRHLQQTNHLPHASPATVRTGNIFLRVLNPGRGKTHTSRKNSRADFTGSSAPNARERPHGRLGARAGLSEAAPRPGVPSEQASRARCHRGLLDTLSPASLPSQPPRQGPPDAARAVWDSQWPHTDLSFYRTGGPEATPGSRSFLASQTAVSSGSRERSCSTVHTPPRVCLGGQARLPWEHSDRGLVHLGFNLFFWWDFVRAHGIYFSFSKRCSRRPFPSLASSSPQPLAQTHPRAGWTDHAFLKHRPNQKESTKSYLQKRKPL